MGLLYNILVDFSLATMKVDHQIFQLYFMVYGDLMQYKCQENNLLIGVLQTSSRILMSAPAESRS